MKKQLSIDSFKPKYTFDIRPVTHYSLYELLNHGYLIDFDIKLTSGLNLQRDYVWSISQKQELIKSVMKNIEIPSFYVILYSDDIKSSGNYGQKTFKIIDGKQRLSTLIDFIDCKFPIVIEDEDYYFSDFDQSAKYQLMSRFSLKFQTIYEYPDQKVSDDDLINLFEMVNFAGTQQDIEHFNRLKNSQKSNKDIIKTAIDETNEKFPHTMEKLKNS